MAKSNPAQILLKNVRFAYVHVFEKDELADKYTCRILVPKNTPQLGEIQAAIKAACSSPNGVKALGGKVIPWTEVLHDGDAKLTKGRQPVHPGYYYLNAKSSNKPGVVKVNSTDIGGKTMEITDESEFYSGCYGWADLGFFAFNQGVNYGISVGLNNVLKIGGEDGLGNGEFMGGRASAESVFGAELEDNYDDELS